MLILKTRLCAFHQIVKAIYNQIHSFNFAAEDYPTAEDWEVNLVKGKQTWMREVYDNRKALLAADGK